MNLQQLDEGLYVVERPFRFLGLEVGTRMTVARLSNGELWVHSAFDPGEQILEELRGLGRTAHVVCPNRLHHVLVKDFLRHFPEARLYLSSALPSKRPDLAHGYILGDVVPDEWGDEIKAAVLRGHLYLDEIVFFHRPSRTLIVTDLIQHFDGSGPWYQRLVGKLIGVHNRHSSPLDMRLTFSSRPAARAWAERILRWDFDRIVLAHGPVLESGGYEVFRESYGFLLSSPSR